MRVLDLYITKVCNLNCEYCYVDVTKTEKWSFSVASIERINLLKYDSIKFFWWEPLLKWKLIKKIIQLVKEKNKEISFTIVTNGVLLTEEKVNYALENDIHFVVSIHDGGRKHIHSNLSSLKKLGTQLWFYIIFIPDNFSLALRDFLFFTKHWFKNFSFAPEIYANWDQENIKAFTSILDIIYPYIVKYSINIGGISAYDLKSINRWCEKTVIDDNWNFSLCNRFKKVTENQNFSYKKIYDAFEEEIHFDSNPDRWFYICPIWWFLDHNEAWNIKNKILQFDELNKLFVSFFRRLNLGKINYLSEWISHYRFNITKQCNIRCSYCYVDFKNEALDFWVWKNILDFLLEQKWNTKTVSFFWWEPLLEFELLKKLTLHAKQRAMELNKKVNFCIATNFMLMNEKSMSFLKENNFDIHISINGDPNNNNILRDNSSDLVFSKVDTLMSNSDKKNICILIAFWPNEVKNIRVNILYLINKGFVKFNFELIYGENFTWKKQDIVNAVKEIKFLYTQHPELDIMNTHKSENFLDIDTKGTCSDNSLEFYNVSIDRNISKLFKFLIKNI